MEATKGKIDWQAVHEQARTLLGEYLRINTTNPPGGEEAGALFLRDVLEREGISAELHDAGDARVSLSARLASTAGSGEKPVVLLSHIDVVPAEREHWSVEPFSGALIDGVLWGRGALDMKGMGIMELMVLLLIKRHRLPMRRDLLLVAVADEEEGGRHGIRFLERCAPQLLEASYVFNEGAYGLREFLGQEVRVFGLGPSEKSPCWLRLVVSGQPGHASVPHANNALARLVRALARIEREERQARLTSPLKAMFQTLEHEGLIPSGLDPQEHATLEALGGMDAHLAAISHDTVSLTSLHAGAKHNVIPALAEATLDCRLLPDTDPQAFVEKLGRLIDDPQVEIVRVLEHCSGQSSLDTAAVRMVREVIAERFHDGACVVPMLSPGFTDSHVYRAAGAEAYGFIPVLLSREDLSTIHGHNERISTENLALGTELLFEVVCRLLAS